MNPTAQPPLLVEMRSIGRRFGHVVALECGNFHIRAGEVVALVGNHGANKSTLMKILAGAIGPVLEAYCWMVSRSA